MKIDKKLLKIILEEHDGYDKDYPPNKYDRKHARETVSQIKQSILKAIMEEKPKESHINYHIEDGIEYRDQNDIPVSISWEKGYNRALEEFESVIKEVLK